MLFFVTVGLLLFIADIVATYLGLWETGLASKIFFLIGFLITAVVFLRIVPKNIKAAEKKETNQTSRMDSVPKALPALTRAAKVQKRAAEVGFDWDDISGALNKIKEETDEVIEASREAQDAEHIAEELGDLLFSVVNASRFLKVDPEDALNSATRKFIRRFAYVEEQSLACGKPLEDMSLEEMDKLWDEAKRLEKNTKM